MDKMFEKIARSGICTNHRSLVDNKHGINRAVFGRTYVTGRRDTVSSDGINAPVDSIGGMTGKTAEHLCGTAVGASNTVPIPTILSDFTSAAQSEVFPVPA